jgi:hypothetical protein
MLWSYLEVEFPREFKKTSQVAGVETSTGLLFVL